MFVDLLRIACCVLFLTSEQKVSEDSSRARPPGTSIIIGRKKIKRSLRGLYEARCRRPVFLEKHSLAAERLIIIGVLVNANDFCGL